MGFVSRDGHQANSRFRQKRYDSAHAGDAAMNAATPPGPSGVPAQDAGAMPAAPMDAMAPKAVQTHITHNHEQGMHHVHTVHEDGTEQHSDHPNAASAHAHAAMASGVDAGGEEAAEAGPEAEGGYPAKRPTAKKKGAKEHEKPKTGEPEDDDFEPEVE